MFENSDLWLREKIKGVSHRSRVTFTVTMAAGICTHMYMLTNKLPNYDELTFGTEGIGVTVSSGRWGLEVIHHISRAVLGGSYSLPWLSGLLAIMFIAMAGCYVVKFLDIRQDVLCALTGAVLVVFPAFTSAMCFMFTARYYAFAIFLVAFGLYWFDMMKSRWLAWAGGVLGIMFATSIFQGYYPFAAGLCVVKLIQMCVAEDGSQYKKVFKKAWSYLLVLVLGVAAYIVSAKFAASVAGDGLSAYRGMADMGHFNVEYVPWMVREVLRSMFMLFTGDFYQVNPTASLRFLLAVICVVTVILAAAEMLPKCREKGGLLLTGELLVFILILPFCMNGIIIMQPDSWFYTLMEYGVISVFLCPIAVLGGAWTRTSVRTVSGAVRKAGDAVITFSLLCCVGIYIWFGNGVYVSMDFAYRSAESYFTSMLTQVRMTEGYTDEMPVYVLGWDSEILDKSFAANGELEVFNMAGKNDSLVHAWNWYAFLETYLNYRQFDWDEKKIDELWSSPDAAAMPSYPDQGSIARLGDGIVIKIADWQG